MTLRLPPYESLRDLMTRWVQVIVKIEFFGYRPGLATKGQMTSFDSLRLIDISCSHNRNPSPSYWLGYYWVPKTCNNTL